MTIEAPPRPAGPPSPEELEALIEEARRRARRRRLLLAASATLIVLVGTSVGLGTYFLVKSKTAATGRGSAVAKPSLLSGTLLLYSSLGNGHVIESIRPDGTGLRRLTRACCEKFAVSPDGKRIAFTRGRVPTQAAVFVLDLRTRHVQRVTPWWSGREGAAARPEWALGGRRIVYARCRVERRSVPCSLWSIRPDGSDTRKLTGGLETYSSFAVSPDGRWVSFTTSPPGWSAEFYSAPPVYQLDAARIDGSDRRVLANGYVSTPGSWSKQGGILFRRYSSGEAQRGTDWAISLSGQLHRYRGVPNGSLIWSPDGTRFVAEGRHILVVNATGQGVERVDRKTGTRAPRTMGAWSPDGSHLAYTEGPSPDIYQSHRHEAVVIVDAATRHVESMIRLRRPAQVVAWSPR